MTRQGFGRLSLPGDVIVATGLVHPSFVDNPFSES